MIKTKMIKYYQRMAFVGAQNVAASIRNHETFSKYRGACAGRKIVICGAGPSLAKYTQPIQGAIHIALNRALLHECVNYDYFVGDDWFGMSFFQDELKKYDCIKFFGTSYGRNKDELIPESFCYEAGAEKYYTDSYLVQSGFESRFIVDIDCFAVGNMPNIALQAIQIALFMHPSEIYLVGCDSTSGHFVKRAKESSYDVQKDKKNMKLAVASDAVINKWHECKEYIEKSYPSVRIISVNPVGLKGIFEDIEM